MSFDLTDIQLADDDLAIGEDYPDQQPFAPPKEANYRIRLVDFDVMKNKDGAVVYQDKANARFPMFNLRELAIVEPEDKKVFPFQTIRSKPYERGGKQASDFADLLRCFDSTRAVRGSEALEFAKEIVETGMIGTVRLVWEARDEDAIKEGIAELGSDADPKEKNAIYKKFTIRGMRKFPKNPDGSYNPSYEFREGVPVTARAQIAEWYPSHRKGLKIG